MRFGLLLVAVGLFGQAPVVDEGAKLKTDLARAQKTLLDWQNLTRYKEANAKLGEPKPGEKRVVFMGDSITDAWAKRTTMFPGGGPNIGRGISGQTTPQMLIRFRPDVIDLKPKVVVILAGTNDIAGNTGPMTLEEIEENLQSMAELAKANKIHVVMSSVMPVCDYHRPQIARRPPEKIIALNEWIKNYCEKNKLVYLDYYSAMLDDAKLLRKEITNDGLHPNEAGYAVMEPLAEAAVKQALKRAK